MRARLLSLVLLVLAAACGSDSGPAGPDDEAAGLRVTAFVAGTPVATLVVEVTATDIPNPLLFNLTAVEGVASGTLKLPPGQARTIAVRAYDDAGEITHEGSIVVNVRPGQNAAVSITLRSRAGQQPITVTFGDVSVIVDPASVVLQAGLSSALTATVIDVDGNPIPATVEWATSNPAFASVDPSGNVTGILAGAVTIAATFDGVVGYSQFTITDGPVGSISGTVSSTVLGPLEGVTVTVGVQSTTTDASGGYSFSLVPAGSRMVAVSDVPITCTAPAAAAADVPADGTVDHDIDVACTPSLAGSFTGTSTSNITATISGIPVSLGSASIFGCNDPCPASASLSHTGPTSLEGTLGIGTSVFTAAAELSTVAGATTILMAPVQATYTGNFGGTSGSLTCTFTPPSFAVTNPTGAASFGGIVPVSCSGTSGVGPITASGTVTFTLSRS